MGDLAAAMLFWTSVAVILYAYLGYPLLLWVVLLGRETVGPGERGREFEWPRLSIVLPVHNGEGTIGGKIRNTLDLDYPVEKREVIVVSDGSTDGTGDVVRSFAGEGARLLETGIRTGKAGALNLALEHASGEIVVFTDSSITLERGALKNLVRPFASPAVGCVSGEDRIAGGEGEGLYGRYELHLRRQESRAGAIVGASGCFYAERRELIEPFPPGMAPDFLSVLNVVEKGRLAVSEPTAVGTMGCLTDPRREFARKVRTFNRGMAALWHKRRLLNPRRYGFFSIELISHKLLRWMVPLFMALALGANAALLHRPPYLLLFGGQALFYGLALLAFLDVGGAARLRAARLPLYFTNVNAALALAWIRFLGGVREEIWDPTERSLRSPD